MTQRYTQEQTDTLVSRYKSATSDAERKQTVEALAKDLQKTPQSVISKLAREGVYVKPQKTDKAGKPQVNKEQFINHIKIMLGARDHELETLLKVSKRDLETVSRLLNRLNDKHDA